MAHHCLIYSGEEKKKIFLTNNAPVIGRKDVLMKEEFKQQFRDLLNQQRKILEAAIAEKRDMSEYEKAEFNLYEEQIVQFEKCLDAGY
jgi:hypothetical protein